MASGMTSAPGLTTESEAIVYSVWYSLASFYHFCASLSSFELLPPIACICTSVWTIVLKLGTTSSADSETQKTEFVSLGAVLNQ